MDDSGYRGIILGKVEWVRSGIIGVQKNKMSLLNYEILRKTDRVNARRIIFLVGDTRARGQSSRIKGVPILRLR